MTVEENRGSCGGDFDDFPKGMRVLAVDDDPTCLKLLDGLLRKCQYHVTATSQARMALNMLRENPNRFDLIITDVHMPDMDGFKLLELVGLQMDLPVIMLSANSDPKMVMKGITHGACDYLVKPVRIEELRNIWQHVVRKKVDSKSRNKSNSNNRDEQESEGGQVPVQADNADQNVKQNRKRKDDEEEGEENENDDDDPSTQKKPRVVWSIELHRKFVAAVNQLGLEKAVPKRILDLMNVEGLTRENVASHLQKYRLYLKRISSAASQQANMVAALGVKDASSYLRMGSLDGLGDFRTFTGGSGRLPNTGLSSYAPSGMLGRLNSPAGLSVRGLNSSAVIQTSHTQNLINPINALGKFQPVVSPAHQNPSLFQGSQSSLELDQLQQSKSVAQFADFNPVDDHRHFTSANNFADTRAGIGISIGCASNPLMLPGNPQQIQNGIGFMNQSSINMPSLNSESFNGGGSGSSNILEDGRCHENWPNAYHLSKFSSNSLSPSEPFSSAQMHSNSMTYNNSPQSIHNQNSPIHFPSNSTMSAPLDDSIGEFQGGLVSNLAPSLNQTNQRFRQHKQDYTHNSHNAFSSLNSLPTGNVGLVPFSQSVEQINGGYSRRMDVSVAGRPNGGSSTLVQHDEAEKSTMSMKLRSNEGYLLEQSKLQGGLTHNNCDSLDDLMSAVMKREQDGTMLSGQDFGYDSYSFGSCI